MQWKDINIYKPENNQQVLATDGKNYHIAIYDEYDGLQCDTCGVGCWVKKSLYWTPLSFEVEKTNE